METVEKAQKPWHQLAFVVGEAGLTLVGSGALFIIISRVSGPELLGMYALATAWLMLFQGVSSFGIPEFLMREVGIYGRQAFGQVAHAMLVAIGSGFVGLCVLLVAVRCLGYSTYLVQVISIAGLALIPSVLNTACRAVFLALREMQLTFLALLVEVVIMMSASLYLLWTGHGAIALMISLVVGKVASASVAMGFLYRRLFSVRLSFSYSVLVRTTRTLFVFGIGNLLAMLTMRINTIMASVWVDIGSVGHYAAATKIMEVGLIVPNLFGQFLMTRIAFSMNTQGDTDPNRFKIWYQALFAMVVPACVGVWVFAEPILVALFGPSFGGAAWTLRILMIYMLVESADNLMSVILKASHRQREDVCRLAFNPLTNIALNLLLLPTVGVVGAAIGRVGGVVVSATLRYVLIAQKLTEVNWFTIARQAALISIGWGAVCYVLSDVERPVWLMLLYAAGTVISLRLTSGFSLSALKEMMSFPSGRD